MSTTIETPFSGGTAVVRPEWIDYNGHMNIGYYLVAFDVASDVFFDFIGLTPQFREQHGSTTFALESHLNYLREVHEGDQLRFETRLLDFDRKRIHFYMEMFHAREGYLAASFESLSSHVSIAARKTSPMPDELYERLGKIKAAHAVLPRPWQVGHSISVTPPAKG
jgi:acyl-CoA thioester hydrolase